MKTLTKMPIITSIRFQNYESDKKKYGCIYSGLLYISETGDLNKTEPVWFMCREKGSHINESYFDVVSHFYGYPDSDTSILNKFIEEYCLLKPNISMSFEKALSSLTNEEVENYKRLYEAMFTKYIL